MNDLSEARSRISAIDAKIAALFEKRMEVSADVAAYKRARGLAVSDPVREAELIRRNSSLLRDESLLPSYSDFMDTVLCLSRERQEQILRDVTTAVWGISAAEAEAVIGYGRKIDCTDAAAACGRVLRGECESAVLPYCGETAAAIAETGLFQNRKTEINGKTYIVAAAQEHRMEHDDVQTMAVRTETDAYEIVQKPGALSEAGRYLNLRRKVMVVTDDGVPGRYLETLKRQCTEFYSVCIPRGEASKNTEQLEKILTEMLNASFTRGDCVIALGGGVVGDLAGFAASCYMRGIDFYNIPTTLLAQVDASIGGKTALDFHGVKNAIGAFYAPKCVLVDTDTLHSLEKRQMANGMAEVIKMAATCDAALFEMIETADDPGKMLPVIVRRSMEIKRDIVQRDPKETGLRKVLNFGHTVGHAVESADGTLLHGECVAIGMIPFCGDHVRGRLEAVLRRIGLPVRTSLSAEELFPYMKHDKKAADGMISVVLADEIGSFRFERMTVQEIMKRLEAVR